MDDELEVIRHQMEEKRASLADKLDALENQVMETVQGATAGVSHIVEEVKSTVGLVTEDVQETVETVKETLTEGIQETVDSVKQTLNVNDHIRQHPWLAMGGAFAAGFAGAYLLGPSAAKARGLRTPAPPAAPEPVRAFPTPNTPEKPGSWPESAPPAASEAGVGSAFSAIEEAGAEALTRVKELAVGALMGVLGEVVANSLPPVLKDEASKLMKDLTAKLGGKVLDFSNGADNQQASKGAIRDNRDEAEMGRPVGSASRSDQEPVGQPDRRRTDAGRRGLRTNDRAAQGANGKEP